MPNKLVIVESPAKCSKIQSFLGTGWQVMASMGHIRALAHSLEAVGIERNWEPTYEDLATKRDQIVKLRKAAKDASEVWLATDDDREGEGIAWHICHILKLKPATTPRIVFHEITKQAIQAAVANPGRLDMNRVNAQQSRAMLDMLVGFTLSPVLWKRVAPKLSAGRCQTPALRLVVERDAEINNYTARNFWKLRGTLQPPTGASASTSAKGHLLEITTSEEYTEDVIRTHLKTAAAAKNTMATFRTCKERVATSAAPAPLITSTLQQEASALHGLNPKITMSAAQKLYEAGHITYMRTDNPLLSTEGAELMRNQIRETWGEEYVGNPGQHQIGGEEKPVKTTAKTKATKATTKATKTTTKEPEAPLAQAAHEAIRPTHPDLTEITDMEPVHATVYRLIWRRAMQSQMSAATSNVRTATISLPALPTLSWSAEQSKPLFDGWRVTEHSAKTEESHAMAEAAWTAWTPTWVPGGSANWLTLQGDEVFTKPPGRYTEATLIRELEKKGIGRPSTFASLVTTLFEREYVEKTNAEDSKGKVYETRHLTLSATSANPTETKETHKAGVERNKIAATPLGVSVTECLQRDFADLFAYDFTAAMEADLDKVAEGAKEWKALLQETWDSYKERYEVAMAEKGARTSAAFVGSSGEGEGVKVVQTKKGPLLVRPKAGAEDPKAVEFAPLPKGITAANAAEKLTDKLVAAAFAEAAEQKEGELLGTWGTEGEEIRKKKGPYGWYVQAGGDLRVPWKPEDTLETLVAKLEAKKEAFERIVGPYTIKKGPYGFYFYKKAAGSTAGKKPRFVGVPKSADPATITEAELDAAAAEPPKAKPAAYKKKTKAGE
jgi:DNA topoisomerase-1